MFWNKKEAIPETPWPYKVGDEFNYLGKKMIMSSWFYDITLGSSDRPKSIIAQYLDDHGVIREITFYERQFDSIKK